MTLSGEVVAMALPPGFENPGLPAFTPDKSLLVVPCQDTDNALLVNCKELAMCNSVRLPKGACPWQAKVTPCGRWVLITNSQFAGAVELSPLDRSTICVVRMSDFTLADTVPVGAGPNGITVSPDGATVYVANMRSDSVSVLEVGTWRTLSEIQVGTAPAFVKLTRDGGLVVVTNFAESSVSFIDPVSHSEIHREVVGIPFAPEPCPEWGPGDTVGVAIAEDRRAFITNWRSGEVVVLNIGTKSIINRFKVCDHPFGVEIDHFARVVTITSGMTRRFVAFDLDSYEPLMDIPVDAETLPHGRAARLHHWIADPQHNRILALLAQGVNGMRASMNLNMVSKLM